MDRLPGKVGMVCGDGPIDETDGDLGPATAALHEKGQID
jgi:hypothetical protein